MWQAFVGWLVGLVDWIKSLFGSEDPVSSETEMDADFSFTGAIPDAPDSRDQIFQAEEK